MPEVMWAHFLQTGSRPDDMPWIVRVPHVRARFVLADDICDNRDGIVPVSTA